MFVSKHKSSILFLTIHDDGDDDDDDDNECNSVKISICTPSANASLILRDAFSYLLFA